LGWGASLKDQPKNLYFWRSRVGSEVDLVLKENEKISAYEIKWQKNLYHSKLLLLLSMTLKLS